MFEYTDEVRAVRATKKSDKFNPKFLHELIDDLYADQSKDVRKFITEEILLDSNNKGTFWERCLAKNMPHTTLLGKNTWHKDFSDGTDAKFATAVRYASGVFQASIGIQNKTGPLRVCMAAPGQTHRKLFFMLIPYEFYSTRNPTSPLKVTFESFRPIGEIWDAFQVTWEQVISPVLKVDKNKEIVYTDEYQLLLDSHEIRTN
jgi:hypothetical protein